MSRRQPLTPSPSPPPPPSPSSLPAQINGATKRQHTKLNLLIVDRLKLALPPHAQDPRLLGYGLVAFARIYYAFESAWEEEIRSTEGKDALTNTHDAHIKTWLARLRPAGLARSLRLKEDVDFIALRTHSAMHRILPAQQRMLDEMQTRIREKPHILVAYAWVMYMATFSGGRWIRQQLKNAGEGFWFGTLDLTALEKLPGDLPGYSFLSFDGEDDGEDIKASFKSRLLEAETLLTPHERQDVIGEAIRVFDSCTAVVRELDRIVWWQVFWGKLPTVAFGILVVVCLAYLLLGRRFSAYQ